MLYVWFCAGLNIKDAERFVAHINADNQRTFEKEDLAKLIKQV